MMTYPVVEKFVSINGEGTKAGELAVFIRFKGCNLCCSYCDTKWANNDNAPAELMTSVQIAEYVNASGIRNVTLTGGEPLLQKNLEELIERLMQNGHCVEIETNGSVDIRALAAQQYRPSFTMDYKLPSSGCEQNMLVSNFQYLQTNDTVKFVSGSFDDLECAVGLIKKYSLTEKCHLYFSPVFGRIAPSEIVEFMKEHHLNGTRLQLQMHKYIWEPTKRGV